MKCIEGIGWSESNVISDKRYFFGKKIPKIPDCTSGRIYVTLDQEEFTLLDTFSQIDMLGPIKRIPIRPNYKLYESKDVSNQVKKGRQICTITLPPKFQGQHEDETTEFSQIMEDGYIYTRLLISQNRDLTMLFSKTKSEDGEWVRVLASHL